MPIIKQFLEQFFKNPTKLYLISANVVLASFAVWFFNAGLLPFRNFGDFAFFAALALILGLYRPGWTFLFFVGALALENINLAPKELGLSLRPYQFFGFITIIALLVQALSKRLAFSLPKFAWYDGLPIVFAVAGFLSAVGATNKGASFKQAIIAVTFVALYFLVRIYVQSFEDAKRLVPFFLSSGLVVMIYAIWQNIRFLTGANSFEVMPGRPNGTFAEADWLGVYITFVLAVIFTLIYELNRKSSVISYQSSNQKIEKVSPMTDDRLLIIIKHIKQILLYASLVITILVLILTVSRSAWVGAVFVVVVFLKFVLLGDYAELGNETQSKWKRFVNILKMQQWQWKKAGIQSLFVLFALVVALVIAMPLTRFEIGNRAVSTGGLQKITIACPANIELVIPQSIKNIDEIQPCRHINLEDIEKEKTLGNVVMEVNRPDPNVNIRAEIYQKSWQQIKSHPVFGIGWGSISQILGTDDRGAGLNASNIFLEVYLGSGLLGMLSFVILLGYILVLSVSVFLDNRNKNKNGAVLLFVMAGWVAVIVPNLFNSGIFLGFVWAYLGVAVGLISKNKI